MYTLQENADGNWQAHDNGTPATATHELESEAWRELSRNSQKPLEWLALNTKVRVHTRQCPTCSKWVRPSRWVNGVNECLDCVIQDLRRMNPSNGS